MKSERQEIVSLLRQRGPMTAQQLADVLYPSGKGFREDWDLTAKDKVEMELGRCGPGIRVVDNIPSPDEDIFPGERVDVYAAARAEIQ
jgi:predicted HTH transcriptional regulator